MVLLVGTSWHSGRTDLLVVSGLNCWRMHRATFQCGHAVIRRTRPKKMYAEVGQRRAVWNEARCPGPDRN